jgi:hypothetical protein
LGDPIALAGDDLREFLEIFLASMEGGAGGEAGFDHLADIHQIGQQGPVAGQQRGHRGDESLRAEIADDRALSLPGLDQPDELKNADSIADRSAADTKSLGEFSFRG